MPFKQVKHFIEFILAKEILISNQHKSSPIIWRRIFSVLMRSSFARLHDLTKALALVLQGIL